jgi:acetyl-CoA carboxylase carboxyl transferase subunit beta
MSFFSKPKYSTVTIRTKKKEIPKDLWVKCPKSGEIIYQKQLEQNHKVVPHSGYHFPISAWQRIDLLLEEGSFVEYDTTLESADPLNFKGIASYKDKIQENQKKTGLKDAVISGIGKIKDIEVSLGVMDFRFLGASLGSAAGEKLTRAIERAIDKDLPLVFICASGGARMYEGIFSLMQMAKTSAALARLKAKHLPYICVLTNPTMAGVMASFASLGDIILAEPEALIGFTGPRVIKETTKQELPEGFQSSEFLLGRGLIDQIVPRLELKERIYLFLKALYRRNKRKP